MKKPIRRLSSAFILGIILVLLSTSLAFAGPPLALHIEVYEEIMGGPERFNASGPAVNFGVICPIGMVEDIFFNEYGPTNQSIRFLYLVKAFTCDDGSGTFYVKMRVRLDSSTGGTTARWYFTNGSGAYARPRGHGTLVGISDRNNPGFIWDIYDGKVH